MDREISALRTWHRTCEEVDRCEWVKFSTWKTDGGNYAYRMVEGHGFNDEADAPHAWSLPKPRYRDTREKRNDRVKRLAREYTEIYD